MKNNLLLVFAFVCVMSLPAFAQPADQVRGIVSKLEKFRTEYIQEKVHLHFDKPFYAAGDDMWFKAYVVNAENNKLINLSKILTVELINPKDSVLRSILLPLQAGMAPGDFKLSDSLPEGSYRVQAYTNWMRNYGEEFFFEKIIPIGNSRLSAINSEISYNFSKDGIKENVTALLSYKNADGSALADKDVIYAVQLDGRNIARGRGKTDANGLLTVSFLNNQPFVLKSGTLTATLINGDEKLTHTFPVKATSNNVDVQFFAESGQHIANVRSRIGFKAVSANGKGIAVSGFITDENKTKIAEFKSEYAGIGSFYYLPQPGSVYTATIKFPDGSEKQVALPKPVNGFSMSIDNSNADSLLIRISASPDQVNGDEIILVCQSNSAVNYVAKKSMTANSFVAKIPKSRFPVGIVQLSLFSASRPVAERLVFVRKSENLQVKISAAKSAYNKREKVKLNIDVSDAAGKPVEGAFSLSVIDAAKVDVNPHSETTIFSNLLLSSDLKGYIENPNYYFTENSPEKEKQLDNLMLTQGWRRFTWKNILAENYPPLNFKAEQNLKISGMVKTLGDKPLPQAKVTLFSSSGDGFVLDTIADENGRFSFDNLIFTDSVKFVIQAKNTKGKTNNVQIELDALPPALVTKSANSPDVEVNVNKSIAAYLQNADKQYQEWLKNGLVQRKISLDEIKIVEKKPDVTRSSNLNGPGNADQVIKADKLGNCIDLLQCLRMNVSFFTTSGGIPYFTRNLALRQPINFFLDGIRVDPDFISGIIPQDIETIEVLRTPANTAVYGMNGGGGVIVINTKRGGLSAAKTYTPNILSFSPKGYTLAREFYSPKYDDPKTNIRVADLRSTLYWNPQIITDKAGKASVEFFNHDNAAPIKATLEGLSFTGELARQEFNYTVK